MYHLPIYLSVHLKDCIHHEYKDHIYEKYVCIVYIYICIIRGPKFYVGPRVHGTLSAWMLMEPASSLHVLSVLKLEPLHKYTFSCLIATKNSTNVLKYP